MSKTSCVVCDQDNLLTNGSNLNLPLEGKDMFICLDCFKKKLDHDEDGGGLRILSKDEIIRETFILCELCLSEPALLSHCTSCIINSYHSQMNGFLTILEKEPYG